MALVALGVLAGTALAAEPPTTSAPRNVVPPGTHAGDPRATDSVDLFFDLCVGAYAPSAAKGEANAERFEVERLPPDRSAKLSKGPVRSVRAKASNAMMLISYEPEGLCVVRVSRADEPSIEAAFEASAIDLAGKIQASATPEPARTRKLATA